MSNHLTKPDEYLMIVGTNKTAAASAVTLGTVTVPKNTKWQLDALYAANKKHASGTEYGEYYLEDDQSPVVEYGELVIDGKISSLLESSENRPLQFIGPFAQDQVLSLKGRALSPATLVSSGMARLRRTEESSDDAKSYIS